MDQLLCWNSVGLAQSYYFNSDSSLKYLGKCSEYYITPSIQFSLPYNNLLQQLYFITKVTEYFTLHGTVILWFYPPLIILRHCSKFPLALVYKSQHIQLSQEMCGWERDPYWWQNRTEATITANRFIRYWSTHLKQISHNNIITNFSFDFCIKQSVCKLVPHTIDTKLITYKLHLFILMPDMWKDDLLLL